MRRAHEEDTATYSTNVFSNEAWSNSPTSTYTTNLEVDETVDLSKYAATALPDTFSTSSRTPRYTPSPHSPHYEPAPAQTNSQGNPFDHAAYDGRPSEPLPQNAKYDDMASPLRKRKLGGPVQGVVPEHQNIANGPTTQATPQTPAAPVATQVPQAYAPAPTRAPQDDVAYRPAPQTPIAPTAPIAQQTPTTHAAPPEQQTQPTPQPMSSNFDTVENEIPLSDFEKDFIEEHIDSELNQEVIDLTQEVVEIKTEPIAPSIFNTGPVTYSEPITYNTNDSIFGTQHLDVPDSDRLYKDSKPQRETIQIDIELLRNLFSKVSIKVVVIALVAVLLLVAAFLLVKPATSSNQNVPTNSSESSFSGSEKTVVPSVDQSGGVADPSVTLPQSAPQDPIYVDPNTGSNDYPQDSGAIVTYDENGNAVYSSPTNQNFNGQ